MTDARQHIIDEAMTWLGTPWHHNALLKGVGVDCAQFLIGVYAGVGAVPNITTGWYPRDWHLHRNEPMFLNFLRQYADPVEDGKKGDIAMWRFGRHPAHGSIVIDETHIIHAFRDEKAVVITDLTQSNINSRFAGYYRLKGLE